MRTWIGWLQAWIGSWPEDAAAWPRGLVRPLVVAFMIALMIVTTLAVLGTAFWGWRFGLGRADLATRINTVAAVSAFVLVAATLFVALIAYLAATGQPDLTVGVNGQEPGTHRALELLASQHMIVTAKFHTEQLLVSLVNRSRYSARNPGVRIVLWGLAKLRPQQGWIVVNDGSVGGTAVIQWDGGADQMIHGSWSRSLPVLDLAGATLTYQSPERKPYPELKMYVVADGVKPTLHSFDLRVEQVPGEPLHGAADRAPAVTPDSDSGSAG